MSCKGVDLRRLTADDLSYQPKCFERDGHAELYRHLSWCILFPQDDTNPHYYMRNMEPDYYRWGGIVRLGDGPLSCQTSRHHSDIAQDDTRTSVYRKISDDPITYEMRSEKPFTEFRYTETGATWKEADVFDLKVEYFPYTIFVHTNSPQQIPYWHTHCLLTGTYEGKPIQALGCFDRLFAPNGDRGAIIGTATHYVWSYYAGIRQDGRKECAYLNIHSRNGHGVAAYWLEGEEPVLTDEVTLECDWQRLPYAEPGDDTLSYTNAVWRFAGKEIHFTGKWGSKGFTAQPRLSRVGQSQSFGSWYEGKTPYEHKLFHTINENMGANIESIRKMGFEAKE